MKAALMLAGLALLTSCDARVTPAGPGPKPPTEEKTVEKTTKVNPPGPGNTVEKKTTVTTETKH